MKIMLFSAVLLLPALWYSLTQLIKAGEAVQAIQLELQLHRAQDLAVQLSDRPDLWRHAPPPYTAFRARPGRSTAVAAVDEGGFYLPALYSDKLAAAISTADAEARYLIIDKQQRIRVDSRLSALGAAAVTTTPDKPSWYSAWLAKISRQLQTGIISLSSTSRSLTYQETVSTISRVGVNNTPDSFLVLLPDNRQLLIGCWPVEKSTNDITAPGVAVAMQDIQLGRDVFADISARIMLASAATLFGAFFLILFASMRIAGRLKRLGRETKRSTEQYGNQKNTYLYKAMDAGDEIGELARNVSSILSRLDQHNQFLQHMPRTLRHEINNPLNVVSTSLQNLADVNQEAGISKYMDSAKRGVMRIGSIVQYLADTVTLEEALKSEDQEVIDLGLLLKQYVDNCRNVYSNVPFDYRGPHHPIYTRVSDYRIEQLLDKIIDNAVDFQIPGTQIKVSLSTFRGWLHITVSNYGPVLPKKLENSLFDSMVTDRDSSKKSKLHFGLGLYVVRVIAEHHGGFVTAKNLVDLSGVQITVALPRVAVYRAVRPEPAKKATGAQD